MIRYLLFITAFVSFLSANIPPSTYDALNRLTSVTDAQGTTSYDYDAIGRQTKATYPNGVSTHYEYDSRNRVTKIEHRKSDGTVLQSFAYT